MKTIGQLRKEIESLPDDTPICQSCNYELLATDEEPNEWYCPNEICMDITHYPVN